MAGWFFWCLLLSGVFPQKVGKEMVRRSFIHHFGRELNWWTTLLIALATLVIIDLVVQSVRRVYWPTDQDLMQRIEKDAGAREALREHAARTEAGFLSDMEDIEMRDLNLVPGRVDGRRRSRTDKAEIPSGSSSSSGGGNGHFTTVTYHGGTEERSQKQTAHVSVAECAQTPAIPAAFDKKEGVFGRLKTKMKRVGRL